MILWSETGQNLKTTIEIFIPENNKLTFDGIACMI